MSDIERKIDPADVADAHYNRSGGRVPYKELVEEFNLPGGSQAKASADVLSGLVREWDKRGMIRHTVLRHNTEFLPRKPDLEDEIRCLYSLRQVVVVDIASLVCPGGTPGSHPDQWNRYDDEIHERLGAWGGRLLASCLRPEDKIGTGGGRGPHFAVDRCRAGLANRYSGNIVPLTGRISTHAWDKKGGTSYLDADNVASSLHGKLGTQGKVDSPNCSITAGRKLPSTEEVTVAVIGIGALGGGHRLKHFEELGDVKSVRPVLRELNKMAELIEKATAGKGAPFYHPVGDVCNWYFVVNEAGDGGLLKERRSLEGAVKELNRKFMNTTPELLARIAKRGMVVAVAGGPHKVAAIRHVLCKGRGGPWITHLVIDHLTAGWILEGEKETGEVAADNS